MLLSLKKYWKMNKVGIVTLPLHFNFGGILQAYALQQAVSCLGYDTVVIRQKKKTLKESVKWLLYNFSGVYKFVNTNIHFLTLQEPFSSIELSKNKISALIVGSDQVWRPCMGVNRIENVYRYFLKSDGKAQIKKIAYAASFGVDYWDFTEKETAIAKALIKDFDAVSVRENTGVGLSDKYLGYKNALQVLDPTMLLQKSDYEKFISTNPFKTDKRHCFVYLLDYANERNKKIVENIIGDDAEQLVSKVERNPIKKYLNSNGTIEEWLSLIFYSDIVITDSFHGCVFSILFHKDFYVMGNTIGGNARISSLLDMLGLQHRYIGKDMVKFDKKPINWSQVEEILDKKRTQSISYLKVSLK